jgi:hypothetical protein
MKFYAYCLTEDIDALPEARQGVAGAEVRLFKTENFSLLVSEFSGDAVPVNRENALAHAAVVRSVLDRTTPLPFRFGTLGTEDQLRSYVAARREALLAKFAQVRGCVEMNVKIISGPDLTQEIDRVEEKPGTSFLIQKRQEILGTEKAKEVAGWLDDLVAGYVRGKEFNTNVTDQLVLSAAHLVEREVVSQYRERVKAARSERPDLKFLISGPWPPYSFANIDL